MQGKKKYLKLLLDLQTSRGVTTVPERICYHQTNLRGCDSAEPSAFNIDGERTSQFCFVESQLNSDFGKVL